MAVIICFVSFVMLVIIACIRVTDDKEDFDDQG